MGFTLEVSTTCTGAAGAGLGGNATGVFGALAAEPPGVGVSAPGSSFFSSSTVSENFVNTPASRNLDRTQLGANVFFVVRQLRREIDQLPGKHPARRASRGEDHHHHEKHRGDPTEPTLDSRHQWRQEKREQCRKRERNEEIAREIERGDDEGRQRDRPEADKRVSGCGFAFGRLH